MVGKEFEGNVVPAAKLWTCQPARLDMLDYIVDVSYN